MWLVDSGSSCFLSPHVQHVLLPEDTDVSLTGIGSAQFRSKSELFLTTMDSEGEYNTLIYPKCYNVAPDTLEFAIASTGSLERCGYKFHIEADNAYYTTPRDRTVRLVTDQVTGFHFIVEHVDAAPSVSGRNCVRQQLLDAQQPDRAAFCYQSEPETKPDVCHTAESLDTYLRHTVRGGFLGIRFALPSRQIRRRVNGSRFKA